MYNEVLRTKWKEQERDRFECTLEGNTEKNLEQLLLAYISENGFIYTSTTHASFPNLLCITSIQGNSLIAIWCLSCMKG